MAIILFLVDTTGSMNQTAYTSFGRLSFLDLAKRSIDMFVERRKRLPESRHDRYMLLTFDEPPHNIKVGWNLNESLDTFQKELSLLEAYCFGSVAVNLKHALDALNIQIIASKLDTYANNFPLEVANIILITEGRKISSPPSILKELTIPTSPLALDEDLIQEGYRWDNRFRFYAIVLRLPGIPVEEDLIFLPPDECDIENLCKTSGGRSFSIKNTKILMRSVEYLIRNIHQGCLLLENDGPSANEPALSALQKKAQEYLIRNTQQSCRYLENDGSSSNEPVLSTLQKKAQTVIQEMHSINLRKRLGLDEEPQLKISSRVNRETAMPSYLEDKLESEFIDFINFNVGVEGKSAPNKQFQIDTIDTPRQKLLDRLIYLRSNFFHFDGRESIDEDIKHSIPISEMMNFEAYMKKIPPALRPVSPTQYDNVTPTLVRRSSIRGPLPKIYTYKKGSPLLRKPDVSSCRFTERASTSSSHIQITKSPTITSSLKVPQLGSEGRKRSNEAAELLSQFENFIGPKRFKVSEENNITSPGPSSQVYQEQVEVCTITRSIIEEYKATIASSQANVEQSSNSSAEEENTVQHGLLSQVPQPDSETSLSTESASHSNVSVQEEPLDLDLTMSHKMANEEAELLSEVENWLKNSIDQMKFIVSVASPGPSSQDDQEQAELCAIIEENKENIVSSQTSVEEENTVQYGPSTQVPQPDSESSSNNVSVQEDPLDLTMSSVEEESTVQQEPSNQVPHVQEGPLDLSIRKYKGFFEWDI